MFKKNLVKKIATVFTAAMLTVMAVVPAFAAGTEDDGLIHPIKGSITSQEEMDLASNVSMSKEKYPYAGLWASTDSQLFETNEKIIEQLGNSYKEGSKVELLGLVSYFNREKKDNLEFYVSGVKANDNIKAVAVYEQYKLNSETEKWEREVSTYVCDTEVNADTEVNVLLPNELTSGKKNQFDIAFIRMTEVNNSTDSGKTDTTDTTKAPAFSNDAKLTDEAGNEVKAENVKSVITALDAVKTAEVNKVLTKNDVAISDSTVADYVDITLNDNNNKVVVLGNGTVVVTVPAKENMTADKYTVKVYHIKADGTMETVPAELTSEGVKITATSFSPYVIVYETKTAADTTKDTTTDATTSDTSATDAASNTQASDSTVKTGDSNAVVLYAAVCAMCVLAGAVALRKKRA